jgi:hypothetical protein
MLPFQSNLDTHETSPQLRSLKCAGKTKSPSLELLVSTHDSSRAHQGNRHFASNRQLGDKKVMTRQFLPSEVSRVECCGQSVVSLHRQQHRFNNRVKYSNTTDSPDQIGTIHVHFSFIQNPHTHNKITWEASRSRARCIRASSATHLDRSNYLANQKHGAIWLCLLDCSRAPPWLGKLFIFSGSQQSSSSDFTWIWLLDLIQDF